MLKKIGNIVLDIVFLLIVIFAIIMIMLSVNTNKEGIASIFGYTPFSIETDAMEPTIMNGDLIFVKQSLDNESLKKDTIISYYYVENEEKIIRTQRIVEVKKTNTMISYVTQGDKEKTPSEKDVAPGDIIGIYSGTKISKLGSLYEFLQSKNGYLICIIIPLFIFFVYQICKFMKVMKDIKEEDKKDEKTE